MKTDSQIDATLRLVGNAQPPSGLERRIQARLAAPRSGLTAIHFISAAAIAASLGIGAVALTPAFRDGEASGRPESAVPRLMARPSGAFGAASAVRVPTAPVPVEPTPVTQGRGHTRSGRVVLPSGVRGPLPRGVAVPRFPQAHIAAKAAPQAAIVSGRQ